jgi:CheY-like chemotaxis protein
MAREKVIARIARRVETGERFDQSHVCDGPSRPCTMVIVGWKHFEVLLVAVAFGQIQYWRQRRREGRKAPSLLGRATVSYVMDSVTTSPADGQTERPKLMIVDDDPEVRIIVAEFLGDFGYQVIQAGGGAEALRLLTEAPDLRMIITDIRMPDMSGIELADLATQRLHDLKIILISGYFVSQQVEWRFLRKPFRMRELEEAVRAELNA